MKQVTYLFIVLLSLWSGGCSSDDPGSEQVQPDVFSISQSDFDSKVAGTMWVRGEREFVCGDGTIREVPLMCGYDRYNTNAFIVEQGVWIRNFMYFASNPGGYEDLRMRHEYDVDFNEKSGEVMLTSRVTHESMVWFVIESVTEDEVVLQRDHGMEYVDIDPETGGLLNIKDAGNYVRVHYHKATPEQIYRIHQLAYAPRRMTRRYSQPLCICVL